MYARTSGARPERRKERRKERRENVSRILTPAEPIDDDDCGYGSKRARDPACVMQASPAAERGSSQIFFLLPHPAYLVAGHTYFFCLDPTTNNNLSHPPSPHKEKQEDPSRQSVHRCCVALTH